MSARLRLAKKPKYRALGFSIDRGVEALDERKAPLAAPSKPTVAPTIQAAKPQVIPRGETDEKGLDNAYASEGNLHLDDKGTLFVAGTKGGFTGPEWIENYVTMGVPLVANALGARGTPYAIEGNKRYDEIDAFMKEHPGEVKNLV